MSVFHEINDKISASISSILDKYNITVQDYLMTPTDPAAHREIMEIFAQNIPNKAICEAVTSINRNIRIDISSESTNPDYLDRDDYRLSTIIMKYTTEFLGNHFTIEDGKAITTNVEQFQFPDMSDNYDKRKNMEYINSKLKHVDPEVKEAVGYDNAELCMLIMPGGTSYFSPVDHEELAQWLNVNGINIDKAVRFESNKKLGDFAMSSLHNKFLSKTSNDDALIEITNPQADMLSKLYGTLLKGWVWMQPLDSQLRASNGLGIGKNEKWDQAGLSGKNIKRLHNHLSDYFSLKEYISEMNSSNNFHNPLH